MRATRASGNTTIYLTLTVNRVPPPTTLTYSATQATYLKGRPINVNYSYYSGGVTIGITNQYNGFALPAFSVSPPLPPGFYLSTNRWEYGAIKGIPSAVTPEGTYTVAVSQARYLDAKATLRTRVDEPPSS